MKKIEENPRFKDLFKAENEARIKQWEDYGLSRIRADLENRNGKQVVGGTSKNRDLAWLWVEYKEEETKQASEKTTIQKIIYNPWTIGITCTVLGAFLGVLLTLLFIN